eukprot:scaffold16689_cov107-Cylindrotheca_fusiformis.AAC.4
MIREHYSFSSGLYPVTASEHFESSPFMTGYGGVGQQRTVGGVRKEGGELTLKPSASEVSHFSHSKTMMASHCRSLCLGPQ